MGSAPPNTPVTVTAVASGCPNPNPEYEFWLRAPGQACCTLAQAYSTTASLAWNTSGLVSGTYYFAVWTKDANSSGAFANNLGRYDAGYVFAYNLTANVCTGVNAAAAPPSPQPAGTPVAITAGASGCPNPRYQFFVLYPGSQTWLLAQAYSAAATFNWNTTGKPAGTYNFSAWARDASSSGVAGGSLGTWDRYTTLQFTLTSTPCSSVSAGSNPSGSTSTGTPVTITGSASGCPNPQYQFWLLAPGSQTWQLAQAYSTSATFNWSTTGKPTGTYHFSVWARDNSSPGTGGNSLGTWDAYTALAYVLH